MGQPLGRPLSPGPWVRLQAHHIIIPLCVRTCRQSDGAWSNYALHPPSGNAPPVLSVCTQMSMYGRASVCVTASVRVLCHPVAHRVPPGTRVLTTAHLTVKTTLHT